MATRRQRSIACDRCGGERLVLIPKHNVSPYVGVSFLPAAVGPVVCLDCEYNNTPYTYSMGGGPFSMHDILRDVPVPWHYILIGLFDELHTRYGWGGVLAKAPHEINGRLSPLTDVISPWQTDFKVGLKIHVTYLEAELDCLHTPYEKRS